MSLATNLSLIAVSGFGPFGSVLTSRGSTISPVFSAVGGGNLQSINAKNGLAVNTTTGNVTVSSTQIELLSAFNFDFTQTGSPVSFPDAWLGDFNFNATVPRSIPLACGDFSNYRPLSSYGSVTINENTTFNFVVDAFTAYSGSYSGAYNYPYYPWKNIHIRYAIGPSFNTWYTSYSSPQILPNVIDSALIFGGLGHKTYAGGGNNTYGSGSITLSAGTYIFDVQTMDTIRLGTNNITSLGLQGTLLIYKNKY